MKLPRNARAATRIGGTGATNHWIIAKWGGKAKPLNPEDRLLLTTYTSFWKQLGTMFPRSAKMGEEDVDERHSEMDLREHDFFHNEEVRKDFLVSDFEELEQIQEQIRMQQQGARQQTDAPVAAQVQEAQQQFVQERV